MKRKPYRVPKWMKDHESKDDMRFTGIEKQIAELMNVIPQSVENAVDKKINGKLLDIKETLRLQNEDIAPIIKTFKENKIIKAHWDSDAKKIVLYTGAMTGIGAVIWGFIKFGKQIILHIP